MRSLQLLQRSRGASAQGLHMKPKLRAGQRNNVHQLLQQRRLLRNDVQQRFGQCGVSNRVLCLNNTSGSSSKQQEQQP